MKTTILSHKKSITRSAIFAILCFAILCFININSASALTYQSSHEIGFEFNPTVSITLSGDLVINNLSPGSTSDSNIVNVSVATNNATGYTLLATAGTSSTNTNLVNTANNSYKFTSIATNANLASLTTDNTWGFSYSSDNGSTWSNYSGLPLDNNDEGATGKQLAQTSSISSSTPIKVKIGAKASNSQASGTYANVINFYAVANPLSGRNYTVNYVDPGGEAVNMPAQQTGVTDNNQITLSDLSEDGYPSSYEGYEFVSWCTSYDGSTFPETCYDDEYYPGETITVAEGTGAIVIDLYPTWLYYGGNDYTVNIDNQSDAQIGGDLPAEPNAWESYSCNINVDCPSSYSIEIISPSSCPSNWNWEANIEYWDGEFMELYASYGGSGDGSFTMDIDTPNEYYVTITGFCQNGSGD